MNLKTCFIQLFLAVLVAGPHLQLDSTYIDMGTVSPDKVATTTMRFCNTGDSALVIKNIFSDCGCTVPSFPREAVDPGKDGEITVKFNPAGRKPGHFRKVLRIKSNADNSREVLIIKGRISR